MHPPEKIEPYSTVTWKSNIHTIQKGPTSKTRDCGHCVWSQATRICPVLGAEAKFRWVHPPAKIVPYSTVTRKSNMHTMQKGPTSKTRDCGIFGIIPSAPPARNLEILIWIYCERFEFVIAVQ